MRILIITFVILVLGLMDLLNPVRNTFHQFTAPVQFGLRKNANNIKESISLFSNLNNIRHEYLELRKENQELRSIVVDLKKSEEENSVLRTQLELKNTSTFDKDLIIASVMGNSKDLTGTSLMIDKGSRQGVQVGDNVILGNFLVGIITATTEERSILHFVTSPDSSMTVTNVELNSGAEGIAQGDLGTSIRVSRILPGERVEEGDVFVTSGKDGNYLPGLAVGIVTEVAFESADPLKSAVLIPMTDFARLEKVFVILNQ